MIDRKIIRAWYGGVGDSLQHSWIPETFTNLGYDVYVSNQTPFRNPQIKELVWQRNPFVKGFTDEPGNCGDIQGIEYKNYGFGFLGNWKKAHGVDPIPEYPQLYYDPHTLETLKETTVIDVTCSSLKDDYDSDALRKYIQRNYDPKHSVVTVFENGISNQVLFLEGYNAIFIKSIFDYCDIIHSCEQYVCLHSGGNSLASGLQHYGKIDATCLLTTHPKLLSAELNKLYMYDNIKYVWL